MQVKIGLEFLATELVTAILEKEFPSDLIQNVNTTTFATNTRKVLTVLTNLTCNLLDVYIVLKLSFQVRACV